MDAGANDTLNEINRKVDGIHEKIDQLDQKVVATHKQAEAARDEATALHTRHDNTDQALGHMDGKLTRLRRIVVAAFSGNLTKVMEEFHDK